MVNVGRTIARESFQRRLSMEALAPTEHFHARSDRSLPTLCIAYHFTRKIAIRSLDYKLSDLITVACYVMK